MISLHKGTISLESTIDKGSVFTITLPLSNHIDYKDTSFIMADNINQNIEKKIHHHQLKNKSLSNSNGRILIVDDDHVNLTFLSNMLYKENYEVKTVQSGKDALSEINKTKSFQKNTFDIVLLDLMMPEMSGNEVCKEIRTQFHLFELPILILTARPGIIELITSFESGANDYLNKPINRQELLARVKTLVTLKKNVINHQAAEYKLLQKRMSPHFLFNALNSIHSLLLRKPKEADEALIKLANNYRFLMDNYTKDLIPFEKEWDFVENYIDLESMRFGDIINFKIIKNYDLKEELIPPLTIQPLVENAIKHGLRNKIKGGEINITAKKDKNTVKITVSDDGLGLKSNDLFSRSLDNIKKRLKYHYPESDLTIKNRDPQGVIATIYFSI